MLLIRSQKIEKTHFAPYRAFQATGFLDPEANIENIGYWMLMKHLLYPVILIGLSAACGSDPVPPKSNQRAVLMTAEPNDPLAGQRPAPVVPITNVHEHMMGESELAPLLASMDTVGIERTVVLGSPIYTFQLGQNGFTQYDDNNNTVLGLAQLEPDRIIPFVVIYPEDEDAPQKLQKYITQGAKGVKLFAGHGASHGHGPFHTMPLDDPKLNAVYEVIKQNNLPVLFHVNYAKFKDEFERVLTAHPTMKVLCPHFCLTLRDTRKVNSLLERHPNLWMDASFGWIQFQAEGYRRIDAKPEKVRKVIEAHSDRFLYGTDLVLTDYENKDEEWITMNMSFYRDLLERETYSFYGLSGGPLTGLNLSETVLTKIYRDNATAWLDGAPATDAGEEDKKEQ